jgi:hypothetical protein
LVGLIGPLGSTADPSPDVVRSESISRDSQAGWSFDQGQGAGCRLPLMRRALIPGLVILAGVACGCSGPTPEARQAAQGVSAPLNTTTTTPQVDPACRQSTPTGQCRLESTAIAVWTEVQNAQAQAAQLQASEQQYATCVSYAALDRSLAASAIPANAPVWKSCPTTGLTPAEVHEILGLIMQAA